MKKYLVFKNEPNAIVHEIIATSKREALAVWNSRKKMQYKFCTYDKIYQYELVSAYDWQHYNFSKVSYLCL